MIPAIVVIFLVVAFVFFKYLQLPQASNIQALDDSIDARINQLKQEFQQRSKELKKRLGQGDLDKDEWQKLNEELEVDTAHSLGSMAESKKGRVEGFPSWATVLLLLFTIAGAVTAYWFTGSFQAWQQKQTLEQELMLDPNAVLAARKKFEKKPTAESAEKLYLIARVAVDQKPDDATRWRDLAEINNRLQRLDQAWTAIQQALKLAPEDQSVRLVQAQVLAATNDPQDMQSAQMVLSSILKKEPDNTRARMVYGFNAFAMENYAEAASAWKIVAAKEKNNPNIQSMLARSISVAEERAKNGGNKSGDNVQSGENASLFVSLKIPAEVQATLTGNESIFVFAKAANGPPMPLAVQKLSAAMIPDKIELSDSNAMTPQMKLSQFKNVVVSARISKSGNATKTAGDIEAVTATVTGPFNGQLVTLSFAKGEQAIVSASQVSESKPSEAKKSPAKKSESNASKVVANVNVAISISDKIRRKLSGNEVLYVFAKAANGMPMPLAVKRIPVSNIPDHLQLSDKDAMRPSLKMSSQDKVVISARISKSGNAIRQAGDIESNKIEIAAPYAGQDVAIKFN